MNALTFRIDDVSLNTDEVKLTQMVQFLNDSFGHPTIMLSVSPAVSAAPGTGSLGAERPFPALWHTESDFRIFYRMQKLGIPPVALRLAGGNVQLAGHGLVHVDHRLMTRGAQELSIVMCCALVDNPVFVPPFNKWNRKTEDICAEHSIHLVKYSEGWCHLAFHPYTPERKLYYFHTHDFGIDAFRARFS